MELLFSYGTLQLDSVQLSTFGRLLEGKSDVMTGFELSPLKIEDASVIAVSGKSEHTIGRFTGNESDEIDGVVYEITQEELLKSDEYEVAPCLRLKVRLKSGTHAWVYIDGRYPPSQIEKGATD